MANKPSCDELERKIREMKVVEAELRQNEEKYQKLVETLDEALYQMSLPDGTYEYVSPSIQKIFGYTDEQLYANPLLIQKIIHPDFDTYFQEKWTDLLKGIVPPTYKYKITDEDGNERWIVQSNVGIFDENGHISGIQGIIREVTESVKMEEKLKASEQRYRSVYETAPLAFVVWNKECNILEWNDQAEKMFGYCRKEVLGHNFFDLIIPDIEKAVVEQVVENLLKGKLDTHVINQNITKSGNHIWCEWNNAIVKDTEGHIIAALSLGLDITERLKTEEELKEYRQHLEELVEKRTGELESKNKELETFTYSVSHDLKAPLRGIDGYSRLLTEEYADKLDEEGLKFLDNVRKSAEQMTQLIEDLLAYSRMERRSIHTASIDLKALIKMLTFERQHDIDSNHIQIDIKLPFDTIQADSDTLRQVLGNYLDNSIKFSRKQSQPLVEIDGNENNKTWTLWVKDNGIGFDSKYHDRIFQIFQRLHRVEDYQGTGVGLAIVRKAVERIGGRVWAESVLGEGATFFLEIPKI